ncbi:MAG TPA: uroporphyrinogen-III C-methyltransferase [Acidimicrobiales bacterium]|nr:uroporphyrinogen-III C-methyltransferase [Acidimicrobiales bacterium]
MTVYLLGAGPGNADLMTLKGARLLAEAQIVVHDRLVDPSVLSLASPDVETIDVGKRPGRSNNQEMINELLVTLGLEYSSVVRLKGGDPFVFGRGGEEARALQEAGIPFEIIPGVTSALSAPLAAGIPVTHRGVASGVTIVTGHSQDGSTVDFSGLVHPDVTLVILMGVANRAMIAEQLYRGGLSPKTPVAVIESAWTSDQHVLRSSVDGLASLDICPPAVIVVGAVAALDLCDLQSVASLIA